MRTSYFASIFTYIHHKYICRTIGETEDKMKYDSNNNRDYDYNSYSINTTNRQEAKKPQNGHKKIKFKPNKEGMTALLLLALIVIVIIATFVIIIKAIVGKAPAETTGSTTAMQTTESTENPSAVIPEWSKNYVNMPYASSDIHKGKLILVNNSVEYKFPSAVEESRDIVSLWGQEGYNTNYVLGIDAKLRRDIISPMNQMFADLRAALPETFETGEDGKSDKIIVASGYRDYERQQSVYNRTIEEMGEEIGKYYAANPGFSEHHTGLAIDLKIYTYKGATIDFNTAQQDWMIKNCAKYGFVLRYDGSKVNITEILHESWHFRYVGVPHAAYMTENNLCLEEYIDLLRNEYSYSKKPLEYSYDGADYLIYFYPAESAESVTFVPVPASGEYTVSGNNVDGFIVTVKK